MEFVTKLLVLIGPRLIAALAGIVVAKAAQHGLTLDPAEVTGLILATYATVHKMIDSKVNPGDAASGRVASGIKTAAQPGTPNTVVIPPKQ